MYFPELKQLQEANPKLAKVVAKLDSYLAGLQGNSRSHINATDVAQQLGAPRDKILGLLMAASQLGLLGLKFRISCPEGHPIRDYSDIHQIPPSVYCDVCDEEREITSDDVEYFFELPARSLPIAG
jgi:hypothetical protein